jgi:Fe-S-cluster containining protein
MGHPTYMVRDDSNSIWRALPQELKDKVLEHLENLVGDDDGDPCMWLEPDGCRHFEFRPSCCREFEVGGEDCLRFRANLPEHTGCVEEKQ